MDLKNTVIEVLDLDHGQKVKELFEKHGVSVGTFGFNATKSGGAKERYYGVVNGKFNNNNLEYVTSNGAKIVTLETFDSSESNDNLYVKRKDLLIARKAFSCNDWRQGIDNLLKTAYLAGDEDSIDVSSMIPKLKGEGTRDQLNYVKDTLKLNLDGRVKIEKDPKGFKVNGNSALQVRESGEFSGIGFWLGGSFHWEIKTDNLGSTCLIPTKK